MTPPPDRQTEEGLRLLRQPVLPLVRIVGFLFLTGPFARAGEIIDQMTEAIEMADASYEHPASHLRPHQDELDALALMKSETPPIPVITPEGQEIPAMEAVPLLVSQRVLTRELERINSLLCGPCQCALCCTGPDQSHSKLFFEIPLQDEEINHFPLPRTDNAISRQSAPNDEPPLLIDGDAFYETGPRLVRWQNGWSLILPRRSRCPQLDDNGSCWIYQNRPEVCRRPQIFPYLLEQSQGGEDGSRLIHRGKLLAVWDCPYVRRFKEEIARFAEMCELEPVFMHNKS